MENELIKFFIGDSLFCQSYFPGNNLKKCKNGFRFMRELDETYRDLLIAHFSEHIIYKDKYGIFYIWVTAEYAILGILKGILTKRGTFIKFQDNYVIHWNKR